MRSSVHVALEDLCRISVTSLTLPGATVSMKPEQVRRRESRFRINISATVCSKEVSDSDYSDFVYEEVLESLSQTKD